MAWKIESKIVRKVASIDEDRSALEAAIVMTKGLLNNRVMD